MLDHPVVTPENVRFSYTLAGPGTRLVAWLLDLSLVTCFLLLTGMALGLVSRLLGSYASALYGLVVFVVFFGYWIVFEHRQGGRTPGKRVFGLRVVGRGGRPLSLSQVVIRNLVRSVDLLPAIFGVGALCMLFDRDHRRLGDMVAGTLVIRERRVSQPLRFSWRRPGAASPVAGRELSFPADLVRRIPLSEREFLEDLCLRRDALADGVRLELFSQVAEHYQRELEITVPESCSPERLTLLLTAEIAQQRSR